MLVTFLISLEQEPTRTLNLKHMIQNTGMKPRERYLTGTPWFRHSLEQAACVCCDPRGPPQYLLANERTSHSSRAATTVGVAFLRPARASRPVPPPRARASRRVTGERRPGECALDGTPWIPVRCAEHWSIRHGRPPMSGKERRAAVDSRPPPPSADSWSPVPAQADALGLVGPRRERERERERRARAGLLVRP